MINPCLIKVYLNVIQTDSKREKNKSRARVFDLALCRAHHISIFLLADVNGEVPDSLQ